MLFRLVEAGVKSGFVFSGLLYSFPFQRHALNHEEKWDKIKLGLSHSVFGFMGWRICIRLFLLFLVEIMSTPLPCIIT